LVGLTFGLGAVVASGGFALEVFSGVAGLVCDS